MNGQQGLMDMKGQEGRSGHLVVCVLDGHLMVTEVKYIEVLKTWKGIDHSM